MRLLELYRPLSNKKNYYELSHALEERKEHFYTEEPSIDFSPALESRTKKALKKVIAYIIVAVSIAFVAISSIQFNRSEIIAREKEAQLREARERKALIEKYQISVSPHDIFVFANKIALENGYRPITYKGLKEKNPNWIYPGNRFNIESESIIVKEGDTLWDMANARLMERNIRFYRLIESLKEINSTDTEFSTKLRLAEKLAFSEAHKKALILIKDGISDGRKR
jgi:hypothetical protein